MYFIEGFLDKEGKKQGKDPYISKKEKGPIFL